MRKIIISLFCLGLLALAVVLISGLNKTEFVKAGAGQNVYGFAWSENIGWISFNSTNCDPNGDGLSDGTAGCPQPAGSPVANYGVHIDDTGLFSGYAWSEYIGWISFNTSDLAGCPISPCEARLDLGPYNIVSGWARALNPVGKALPETGGWDGWIRLRGTAGAEPYGVFSTTTSPIRELKGFAWGGDDSAEEAVVGWISFSCQNPGQQDVCQTSNYKVLTSFNLRPKPSNLSGQEEYCGVEPGAGSIIFQWTYTDPESDSQDAFTLQIDNNSNFSSPEVTREFSGLGYPSGTLNNQEVRVRAAPGPDNLVFNSTYYWQVRVKAVSGNTNWSEWVQGVGFSTDLHSYPWVDFVWMPPKPLPDDPISFTDSSISYDFDLLINTWRWLFDGVQFSIEQSPVYSTLRPPGNHTVQLTVTDSDGFQCSVSKNISVRFPWSKWKEFLPF